MWFKACWRYTYSLLLIKHFNMLSSWVVKMIPRGVGTAYFTIKKTSKIRKWRHRWRQMWQLLFYCPFKPILHYLALQCFCREGKKSLTSTLESCMTSNGVLAVFIKKLRLLVLFFSGSICCPEQETCFGCMYYSYLLASPLQKTFRVTTSCL